MWDIVTTMLLLLVFFITPYWIAFTDDEEMPWLIIDSIIDFLFLIDIIVNFFSAYYNNKYILIDKWSAIACNYLKGWFFIDLVSIIPFNLFSGGQNYGKLVWLTKLNWLYKLVKLKRLLWMMKGIRDWNKMLWYFNKVFKISVAAERLFFFCFISLLLMHICTCFWILLSNVEDSPDNWTWRMNLQDASELELYVASFYFVVTTIATVGYGDITPKTISERIFCIIIMLLGVTGFSFATGSLSSLMNNIDTVSAKLKYYMNIAD